MSALLKCVLFNFIAMCPSDERPRLYAFGAANKREKKHRLDNVVAGTSKIQSFFETTTASEVETSEGNPGNINDDAVDVAPPVPAPEGEAAAEPAAAKPSPHGPIVQELDLMLDNQTDRTFFQLGTLPSERFFITVHAAQ